ncbi:serine/threonine-protein kinase [Vitiosangium sp. GDMCC 1.1324]|uniref:serine/threonine-protein kinase n=1 Tax=Vitiosangium sp. (strain GDMCC 1.1324) TaxID=2138576 RepID=UPI000D35C67F|nr:serine/threonine-protein kinase [Vitiosangium sp. GDMCC 1.1324]PTL77884.1 serine/threonine protein kinase [Vitiosangium sp. GDMCC 1.1324]
MNESRYRLVRPLATGGMAELFLGVAHGAEGFEKSVAIKRMLPHLAREPAIAKMFVAEARLATHLHHQNIATVYDVGNGPDGLFLVMELVNGWDLGVLLRHAHRRGQRFPPHLVAFIGAQVLAGLVHAYRRVHNGRPVLTAHRDISPSNILVSREGEVKVTDFGIARIEGMSQGTQPGTFKGKLPYSAPETLHGEPATALSDQFALGIVLYELLAGRHPFGTGAEDPMAFAMAITEREPAPLTDIPPPLAAVVMRAMSKAPEARFPRPEDMAEALARYLAQAGEPATSQSLAAFITGLPPPATLVEQGELSEQQGPLAQTVRRPTLPTRAVDPASFELQPVEEWEELPGGAALSSSGRLIGPTPPASAPVPAPPPAPTQPSTPVLARPPLTSTPPRAREARCPRCNALLPSAHAPCDRCARELSPELSTLAEDVASPSSWARPGAAPQRSVLDMKEEELELVDRGPKHGTHYEPPKRPFPWKRVVTTLATLLVVVGVGVVALPHLRILMTRALYASGKKQMPLLSIQSEPPGALVTIDGTELGNTPMVLDNNYPDQEISVQLTLKGYKPWKGRFTGGQPVSLEAKLKR